MNKMKIRIKALMLVAILWVTNMIPGIAQESAQQYFTVDEIVQMSEKDQDLYLYAIRRKCVPRMREILALNPDFTCPEGFIREGILRSLSNDTILELTEEGKREIAEIVLHDLDDTVVFPIQKINKILFHDQIRKMKQKIKEKIVGK